MPLDICHRVKRPTTGGAHFCCKFSEHVAGSGERFGAGECGLGPDVCAQTDLAAGELWKFGGLWVDAVAVGPVLVEDFGDGLPRGSVRI